MRGFGWTLILGIAMWGVAYCAYKSFAEPEIAHAQALFQTVADALNHR